MDSRHTAVDDPEFQPEVPPEPGETEPPLPFAATPLGRTLTYVSLAFVAGMMGGVMGASLVAPHWAYKARQDFPKVLDVEGVNASWLAIRGSEGESRLYMGVNREQQAEFNMSGPEANPGFIVRVDPRGHGSAAFYNGGSKAVELSALGNGEQGVSVYSDKGTIVANVAAESGSHGGIYVYGPNDAGGANLHVTTDGQPILNLYDREGTDVFRAPSEPQKR